MNPGAVRWSLVWFVVVLLTAALVGGPATAFAQTQPEAEKHVLRVGWLGDVDSLNPFIAVNSESYEAFFLMYSLLTTWGQDLESVPDLAESWESSADGLTWTFHLVHNAKWSDGQPVTSADVAFTFNYIVDNEMGMFLNYVKNIESIETPNPYTVVLRMAEPTAFMPQVYVWILPEHVWKDIPPEKAEGDFANENPVGSGPFRLAEYKPGEYIRFEAKKDYFGGAPSLDEVVYVHYANETTLAAALQVGEIDLAARVPEAQFQGIEGQPGIVTLRSAGNRITELAFNCWRDEASKGNPILLDRAFRRAIAHAIDKDKINEVVSFGMATAATSVIPPVLGDFHWEPGPDEVIPFDLVKARALLDEAGYRDSNGDGVREDQKGQPIRLRLFLRSESPLQQKAGQMIAEWLDKIGIQINSQVMDEGTLSDKIYDNGDFDLFIWGWGGDVDPSFLLSVFTTNQIMDWSDCMYSNPAYDQMFEEQQRLIDRRARVDMIHEMQKILYEDCPYVVLRYDPDLQAYRTDKYEGWVRTPRGGNVIMTFSRATYLNLKPIEPGAAGERTGAGLWLGLGAGVVALAVVIALIVRRRPRAA